jgi:hypothetical protein
MNKIELIYDVDCPNLGEARAQLRRALEAAHLPARWREWVRGESTNPPYVEKYGSPTILVDGEDVAVADVADGCSCRLYPDDQGALRRVPALRAIMAALNLGSRT